MPSWWGKSSSKETKKKASKESIIDTLHRKFKIPSEGILNSRSRGTGKHSNDTISEKGGPSPAESRSPSPSKVARCQSFAERPHAQPLPLPGLHPSSVGRVDSEISISSKSRLEKGSKSSLFLPLPRPACIRSRPNPSDLDGDMVASISSGCSGDSDEPAESRNRSPLAADSEIGTRTAASSPSSSMLKDQSSAVSQLNSREAKKPANILSNHMSSTSPKQRPLRNHVPNLQVPPHGAFYSAPDSSLSSPSRSPLRAFGTDQVLNSTFWAGKPYLEVNLAGSGHCSSPGSGHNSGHNSMGGDMSGPLFWQPSRGSPEYSPVPSPRMTSPGPSSRIQSGAVTPIHPRAGGTPTESQIAWADDGKQQSHRLPLPPLTVANSSPFSHSNSAAASPSMPRSPARAENPVSPGSRWKKGRLIGRGTFGHVYVGFNNDSGEMCAMKEVTLFSDDAKSLESAKQLMQEISLLSRLRHQNIVQYYGSETVDDKLYIYLEYVSGGSIYKLLQEYGQFGEPAIRNYTQQILSGLAYLHAKNTVHRDIKGANILVDPNGRVKLADFGMAKHIKGQSCPLSIKGSPYWMAPEVIKNSSGCNLAVDIWSLGCTVLEMATTKPPWSQYEGKKRWGGCWSSYWCFGSHKSSKKIGHAVHVPEPVAPTGQAATTAPNSSTAIVMPFAVPPSSPASVFQSDPSSATQSPAGPLSLTSLSPNAFSCGGPASIFTIGPYAYETQLVSPPAFSNFTTEPSTASFTPPPESVHQTTPSSPEVPFAQLVASSLDQAHKSSGANQKFALFNYDYHSYQQYPGSPGAQLISPGSVISTSGSSTPFPDRHSILEFHKGESPKFLSSEHFAARKWSSRLGSGSLTPDGAGQGSRLGSGSLTPDVAAQGSIVGSRSLTPDVAGQGSRLGSGSLTPDVAGQGSRLGSGSLTPGGVQLASQLGSVCFAPDGMGPDSRLGSVSLTPVHLASQQISGVSSLANSGSGCQSNAALVDHRVSFQFTGEDVARCLANKSGSLLRNISQSSQGVVVEDPVDRERIQKDSNSCDLCAGETSDDKPDNATGEGEKQCCEKHHSFNSSKEFNFDNRKGVSNDAASSSEWWTNKKVVGKEGRSSNSWAFFLMLEPETD